MSRLLYRLSYATVCNYFRRIPTPETRVNAANACGTAARPVHAASSHVLAPRVTNELFIPEVTLENAASVLG